MRRRMANKARAASPPVSITPPPEPTEPVVPKGVCKKCGKHVGKGVWMHSNKCGV